MDQINLLSWNVGGGKFFRLGPKERTEFSKDLNYQLRQLTKAWKPDIIALQEVVQYGSSKRPNNLIRPPKGYFLKICIAVDSERQTSPHKWQESREKGNWPSEEYLGLGNGILWRSDLAHCTLWDSDHPRSDNSLHTEEVHLDLGLYTGDRNTEPRLAVVAHFMFRHGAIFLDVFLVNIHLTTLKREREGIPARDDEGSSIRMQQVDIVLKGIVSRYNEWRSYGARNNSRPPIWILAGDFNCTPESPEYTKITKANFIDLVPDKGSGTKASGLGASEASVTLDYIFAGQTRSALDSSFLRSAIINNPKPWTHIAVSDHYPLFARLPLTAVISPVSETVANTKG